MKASLFSNPTPFTPPTPDVRDQLFCLRLVRSRRVGAVTFHRLIAEYGTAESALEHLPKIAANAGVKDYAPCPEGVARAEMAAGQRAGARLLVSGHAGYPAALRGLTDAPAVLWALGDITLFHKPMISIIGARSASSLGMRMARRLAADLGAAGYVVVSGLARGIDTSAHKAALETGTIAVQGCGIDQVHPPENAAVAAQIAEQGLRLSELPPGYEPRAQHFPQRNRIIAGLGSATLVVEATVKSGSMGTAQMALDYGKDVMAVPGHPIDPRAGGCNALIRDGALLIRDASDVLDHLGVPRPAPVPQVAQAAVPMDDVGARILSALGMTPVSEDALLQDLGLAASDFAAAVVMLELDGLVGRTSGGYICRV